MGCFNPVRMILGEYTITQNKKTYCGTRFGPIKRDLTKHHLFRKYSGLMLPVPPFHIQGVLVCVFNGFIEKLIGNIRNNSLFGVNQLEVFILQA